MAQRVIATDPVICIDTLLDGLSDTPSDCCIFRIHKTLRQVNEQAYDPEIVAIGPYHRDNKNLKMMQEHKLRYFRSLLQQNGENDTSRYVNAIRPLQHEDSLFYAKPVSFTADEMIQIMVLDGCFIIELLRKFDMEHLIHQDDPIFKSIWMVNSLQRDLMLFENQLPFSILCKLFDLIEAPNNHNRLIYLALRFFNDLLPGTYKMQTGNSHGNIRHLLELVHNKWLPLSVTPIGNASSVGTTVGNASSVSTSESRPIGNTSSASTTTENASSVSMPIENASSASATTENASSVSMPIENASSLSAPIGNGNWRFIPNTTELLEAGVKLKKFKVTRGSLFDIKFDKGKLYIPSFTVEDRTESIFRNLIAYEQYCPDNQRSYVTDYVKLLDCLIDSPKDVEILSGLGIIDNWLGHDEAVSNIFNKISDAVSGTSMHFRYADIFNSVNIYCRRPYNRWMANLNRNYCNGPWAAISVLAGSVLILLTLAQTLYAVFPFRKL
ncbi:UPF0481 protein [Camellia lanceoleosa]|uniref:UPF0481 protein n=1 Tax=Camellia lanceoleosa TaxID=1840588 RepID=A0ACC0H873_9ERIC|nr:UPF0481 protein [Camellia lanceoleosa]